MPWPRRGVPAIRVAGIGDLPATQALLAATWHDTYDALLGADRVRQITAEWHALERLAAQIGQPHSAFLVAEAGGSIVGTGFAHMTSPGDAEIGRLYVLRAQRGRRLGTRLLGELIARLPDARRFSLEVEPRNIRAIRFYRRHGFAEAGTSPGCGSGLSAVVMERELTRR